MGNGAAH
jgi:hypothetical protein